MIKNLKLIKNQLYYPKYLLLLYFRILKQTRIKSNQMYYTKYV